MNHAMRYCLLLAVLPLAGCRHNEDSRSIDVTYIANEGFMIAMGDTKLLIDAFSQSKYYASPAESTVAKMTDGIPPFDGIDYLLVTHDHPDHFQAGLVSRFLKSRPGVTIISDSSTCAKLPAGVVPEERMIRLSTARGAHRTIVGKDAEITAIALDHGSSRSMTCMAFLVRSGGRTWMHVGDAILGFSEELLRRLDWSRYDVDILFLEYFDRSTPALDFISKTIKPKYVILMHIPPGEEESVRGEAQGRFERVVVFTRENETREFRIPPEPVPTE